jgi:hypothetical protein
MDAFKKGPRHLVRHESITEEQEENHFLPYAAQSWGKHAQAVETDILQEIVTFLEHPEFLSNVNATTSGILDMDFGISRLKWDELSARQAIAAEGSF